MLKSRLKKKMMMKRKATSFGIAVATGIEAESCCWYCCPAY